MSYRGLEKVNDARSELSEALALLQTGEGLPADVARVAEHVAEAMGELFQAGSVNHEHEGRALVEAALGHLSQTLALLQDVRGEFPGIVEGTEKIASTMGMLHPLTVPLSEYPGGLGHGIDKEAASIAIEANLGATTASNFYVGFSGEVSEGGVFLATFETWPHGTPVKLHVTLPGGYDFHAPGWVQFSRESVIGDVDVQAGVGVRFESLSAEARQLILRFVKKRPPLFFEA